MRSPLLVFALVTVAARGVPAQDEFLASGLIEPAADVAVKARVDGYVSRVFAKPGQTVKALDKLVVLSAPELHAEVGRATAVLAQKEDQIDIFQVELEIARKRMSIAERDVKVSGEDLPKTKETLDTLEKDLRQAEAMHEAGVLSPREISQFRVKLAEARAAWLHAGEQVKNAQDRVEIARLEVRRAELALVQQRSVVNEARAELELARIRAGFAEIQNVLPEATVSDVLVAPGSLAVAGETPLVRLLVLSRVRVSCHVPESALAQVKVGNPVRVVDGRHQADAKVTHVATRARPETGTVEVEIDLDNAEGHWQPGAHVQVVFHPRK